jgi:hypothetical protein
MVVESTVSAGERVGSAGYTLGQNYPNPVGHLSRIWFEIPEEEHVEMTLYDLLGKTIRVLINEVRAAGEHVVELDSKSLLPGFYFYSMRTEDFYQTRKMEVLK